MKTQLNTDLSWLAQYQHPTGGVSYLPNRKPRFEPTTYAVLAGAARPADFDWLLALLPQKLFNNPQPAANPISSPYHVHGRPWIVAAGILALCREQSQQENLNLVACANYFRKNHALDSYVKGMHEPLRDRELMGALPWQSGNYGWVQPTCWGIFTELALLAIASKKDEQELLLSNLTTRIEFILARKTFDQGWNYGNTLIFDVEVPAHPLETAMVLTAFGGINNSEIASYLLFTKFEPEASFEILEQLIQNEGSRLSQAWLQIASNCWQRNIDTDLSKPLDPPGIGESSIDALLEYIAYRTEAQQGFHFLQPNQDS